MSDSGVYAAIEAEVIATIGSLSSLSVAAIIPCCDWEDLLAEVHPKGGGNQGQLVGVQDISMDNVAQYTKTISPFWASCKIAVSYAAQNLRGSHAARVNGRLVMEAIRDRLHWHTSTVPGSGGNQYRCVSERTMPIADSSAHVRVATYELKLLLGQPA